MATSGKKTVTTAGTKVALGTQAVPCPIVVKALSTNTGLIYLGDGTTATSAAGFQLAAGESVVFERVYSLANVYIDAAVNGEGVTWLILDGVG